MNKKAIQIYIAIILSGILLFLTYSCEEKFNDPYENLDNIHLVIQCNYIEECGGSLDTIAAAGADIIILHHNRNTGSTDTLSVETMDSRGILKHQLPDSKGGISNVSFLINYKSFLFSSHMDYLCCDSVFVLEFQRSCDEVFKSEVGCENLNQKFDIDISNKHGDCLVIGTPNDEMRNNSFTIISADPIEIDMNPLLALRGDFTANISPAPNAQGIVRLNENSSLFVTVFTNTSQAGSYQEVIELPVKCVQEEDADGAGIITVEIKAEVCEDVCICPFDTDGKSTYNVDMTNDPLKIHLSKDYDNHFIFKVNSEMLDQSCYFMIKEIKRVGSNLPINTVNLQYNWKITSDDINKSFYINDLFSLSLTFSPTKTGEIEEEFEVITEVYNKYGELSESNCTFIVNLKGFGCEDVCPLITKTNYLPAELVDAVSSNVVGNFQHNDKITMSNDFIINQSMEGLLSSTCWPNLKLDLINYSVSIPNRDDLELCQDIDIELFIQDDGITNDRDFFSASWSLTATRITSLSKQSKSKDFNIGFNPPSNKIHIQSGHDSIYKCKVIIQASDSYGVICSQEIKIEASVNAGSIKMSETQSMKAFSQVSDKESNPSYQAYKIDYYNETYWYHGQIDNLKPVLGHVNMQVTPPAPITNHSFYFEVDNPTNLLLRQMPKLYLVNSELNKYNQITSLPVARYNSNIEFSADLQDLVNTVFKTGTFTSRGVVSNSFLHDISNGTIEWTPSMSAQQMFSSKSGVDINLGDVFIVWNSEGSIDSFESGSFNYSTYCEVAFIYIDGISDGAGTQHHIGNVSFVVAYPLNVVKN